MIETLLVANRAEIACRVIRTARALGIRTVAVYTDVDRDLPHVAAADVAIGIGAPRAYLDPGAILAAARRAGADAVHPGYGFLSENAAFAEAVVAAGLTWVGPPPAAVRAMGDKVAARRLAAAHGVATVPGYDGDDTSPERLLAEAARIGFPVLVKASAGGGGRGMRRVDRPGDLPAAIASAAREAEAAFGNPALLLERYVERPRHIEVQVFADQHGGVVHLGERECSIQRRHQKIVEEAPSPVVTPALREQLGAASVTLASAVGYQGAGTCEFLVDAHGSYFFLEMNTRLQVEHPVTEEVTGLDLVALQLAVAEGQHLPPQDAIVLRGHAIEARLVAEDPNRDFMPTAGPLLRLHLDGARVDAGYATGDAVGVHYDGLVAKIITTGPDRRAATRKMRQALSRAWAPGLPTNLALLREIFDTPAWGAGDLHTGFLGEHGLPGAPPLNLERGAVAATAFAWSLRRRHAPFPATGFRVTGPAIATERWRSGAREVETRHRVVGDGLIVDVLPDRTGSGPDGDASEHRVRVLSHEGDALRLEVDGVVCTVRALLRKKAGATAPTVDDDDVLYLHLGDGEAFLALVPRLPLPAAAADAPGACVAPTPGTVRAVHVAVGDAVEAGASLVTLEAMKMETVLTAAEAGVVASVRVEVGDAVDQGALLVQIDADVPDGAR